jgi:hypothetical protein
MDYWKTSKDRFSAGQEETMKHHVLTKEKLDYTGAQFEANHKKSFPGVS